MLKRFWRDKSANMGVMFAVAITLGLAAATIVVDAGSLYYERRQMQSAVDLAAIAAASDLSKAHLIAQQSLVDAGKLAPGSTSGLKITLGHYDEKISDPVKRFVPGIAPHNAVDVALTKRGTLYFAQNLIDPPWLSVAGTATRIPEASFTVGSRLASLNEGLANMLLGSLLGTTVSLNVADYNSLIGAKVELLRFLDILAQEMDVDVGTYSDLLAMNATGGQISRTLAQTATGLTGSARALLNRPPPPDKAGSSPEDGASVPLENLFSVGRLANLGLGDARAVTGLKLTALEVLNAAATVGDGARILDVGLTAAVPGLASLKVEVAVGDPPNRVPWFQVGPTNSIARTAQVRLYIKAAIGVTLVLIPVQIQLPIWVDVAYAQAELTSVTCPNPLATYGGATLNVTPGIAHAGLSDLPSSTIKDMSKKPVAKRVKLVDVGLITISAFLNMDIGQTRTLPLTFSSGEIGAGAIKSVSTTTVVGSLGSAILSGIDVRIDQLPPLGVEKLVKEIVVAAIMPLAPTLDMTINGLLSLLGVKLSEADVRVVGVRCGGATLIR